MLAPALVGFASSIGVTISAALATSIIGAVLSIGVTLAFKALGVGAVPAAKVTGTPQVFRQSITDSYILYGKRRWGGLMVFFHPRVVGSDHYRYFVIAVAGHQCKGVVTFRLNDEDVTVDAGSGLVTTGKYANAAWLWFKRGTDTDTAFETLVAECDGKWTTAHKGLGVAKIAAKFKMTDAVIQAGPPNITAIWEGKDTILDTRDGVAKYTRNGALVFYDWMTILREEGGFGAFADEVPDASWISAQANVCDETINGNPRYALDAVLTTGSPPGQVRDALVVNLAGKYSYSNGKHLMRPGYWVPPDRTLSGDDLAGGIQVSPFFPPDVAANEIQGTYVSPEDGYQGMPFTTKTAGAADTKQADLDLAFTTVLDQANRVATIMLNRALAEKSVVWPMNCAGIGVRALDTVQVDKPEYGLSNYAWCVASWALSADYGVVTKLQEENEEIYAEPVPVTVAPPPVIDKADPVPLTSDVTRTISLSGTSGLTFSSDSSGNVTISNHNRVYVDKTVAVTGTGGTPIATGAAPGKYVTVYYDQADRSGGAVTYQYLVTDPGADNSAAYASSSNPYRHFVCIVLVPASGTAGGGSSPGDGGGASGPGGPGTVEP